MYLMREFPFIHYEDIEYTVVYLEKVRDCNFMYLMIEFLFIHYKDIVYIVVYFEKVRDFNFMYLMTEFPFIHYEDIVYTVVYFENVQALILKLSLCVTSYDLAFISSKDSDQPRHPLSLIRVFTVRMYKAMVLI